MVLITTIPFAVILFYYKYLIILQVFSQEILYASSQLMQTTSTISLRLNSETVPLQEIDRKSSFELDIIRQIVKIINCTDKPRIKRMHIRGPYWVLYNFVIPDTTYMCHESITLTTQADFSFLGNLLPMVERWRGPISIAIYAPGDDFQTSLNAIAYLRHCQSKLIKRYVSFHIFFDNSHLPTKVDDRIIDDKFVDYYNCTKAYPPYLIPQNTSYRIKNNLTYPINTARNIAREEGLTHFVLASDIELRPSRKFITRFMQMIARNPEVFDESTPKIYVLPVFEVLENATVPSYKKDLVNMLQDKKAFVFHEKICKICHEIPKFNKWISTKYSEEINVFVTTKRQGKERLWEAFYVGTQNDPVFDERLVWEGQSNKMTQGYALCLLDYDYIILDNAFLVHKPGVKIGKVQLQKYSQIVGETDYFLRHYAKEELDNIYGKRDGCFLYI